MISNDDGYQANGIRSLVDMLRDMAEIIVCAPDSARSGYSCAFSAEPPLRIVRRNNMGDGVEVWSCSGTPADCVKVAVAELCGGRRPDLIIGGINHGANNTINCHYSGTVGIAIEGTMKYIPSLAFSLCSFNHDEDMSPMRPYVRHIVEETLKRGLPKGVFLNVNFPVGDSYLGVKVCRMTYGRWVNEVEKRHHPRGYDYYWMVGNYVNDEPDAIDSDEYAISQGYVAITPTDLDVTAYRFMDDLQHWELYD